MCDKESPFTQLWLYVKLPNYLCHLCVVSMIPQYTYAPSVLLVICTYMYKTTLFFIIYRYIFIYFLILFRKIANLETFFRKITNLVILNITNYIFWNKKSSKIGITKPSPINREFSNNLLLLVLIFFWKIIMLCKKMLPCPLRSFDVPLPQARKKIPS